MTIFDTALVALCGLILGVVFGYAFWIRVRVIGLRADLLDIFGELGEKVAKSNASADPGFLATAKIFELNIRFADSFSYALLSYCGKTGPKEPFTPPKSPRSDVQEWINEAIERTRERIADYISKETLSGLIRHSLFARFHKKMIDPAKIIEPFDVFSRWPAGA